MNLKATRDDFANAYRALANMQVTGVVPPKFRYTKEYNIQKIDRIMRSLEAASRIDDAFQEDQKAYGEAYNTLLEQHARKDENGNPIQAQVQGSVQIADQNAWKAAIEKLDTEYAELKREQNRVNAGIKELLQEEIEVDLHVFIESDDPALNTMASLTPTPQNEQNYRALFKIGMIVADWDKAE